MSEKTDALKTYVLVHGAYHGGWCWRDVACALRSKGHCVFTPTLTGLGERAHLLQTDPDLYLHIDDIVQVIEMEELHDIILVGHSYAGCVISGVADRIPERIRHLIYLDALILQPGTAMIDFSPPEVHEKYQALRRRNGGRGTNSIPPLEFFGAFSAEQSAWLQRRLTPQPIETFFSEMRLQNEIGNNLPTTYITCTNPYFHHTEASRNYADTRSDWKHIVIDTCHDAMITAPQQIVELL